MFRTAIRPLCRSLRTTRHTQHSFASTVLLSSKTYEDRTVAELRTELRSRGLSASGNKARLISRIQQADARNKAEPPSSTSQSPPKAACASSQTTTRGVSSSSTTRAEVAPNQPEFIPPSPAPHVKFDIKLPDVSQDPPEPHVQVPFVPDFWDSSIKNAEEASSTPESLSSTPKIMLAAGANTYPAGGPTYAMSPAADTLPSNDLPSSTPPRKYEGIVGDVLDDLNIPHNVLSATPRSTAELSQLELSAKRTFNRPLDEEERRGALTLLGLIFGAWVAAGLAAPSRGKSKGNEKH